jgi:hypothetical protein
MKCIPSKQKINSSMSANKIGSQEMHPSPKISVKATEAIKNN